MESEQSKKGSEISNIFNKQIQNTKVLSVLRFSKTVNEKPAKPELGDALQFINIIDFQWKEKFRLNFQSKEITFRKSKDNLFFALTEKDPKNLIGELCRVINENKITDKNTRFEFTLARRNLWKQESWIEVEFHNGPDFDNNDEAMETYKAFGEVAEMVSYGSHDVVRFSKINPYLVLRWHSQNLSNKKKKTEIFKVVDSHSVTAKFTSKVSCKKCRGIGHQTSLCPEGVLPLLDDFYKINPKPSKPLVAEDCRHRSDEADGIASQEVFTLPVQSSDGSKKSHETRNNKPTSRSKKDAVKEKKKDEMSSKEEKKDELRKKEEGTKKKEKPREKAEPKNRIKGNKTKTSVDEENPLADKFRAMFRKKQKKNLSEEDDEGHEVKDEDYVDESQHDSED